MREDILQEMTRSGTKRWSSAWVREAVFNDGAGEEEIVME